MSFKGIIGLLLMIALLDACNRLNETTGSDNPPAEGFDLANSDPAAVELADSIMVAMGGFESWDNTRFISWSSSGVRNLIWDKKQQRARIESIRDSTTYLVDLINLSGKAFVKGQEVKKGDSLKNMLNRAKNIWSNDSYWLFMPFKLKDNGVTLKYLGEDTLRTGDRCNVLQIIHNDTNDIPLAKYHVYVDLADNLVKQWAYYSNASQDSATFLLPWDNYKKYGNILLSSDRSEGGGPVNVSVDDTLSDSIFTTLE